MKKYYFFLSVLLPITTIFISGCIKKADNQSLNSGNTESNSNAVQNHEQDANQTENQNQAEPQSNEIVNPSGQYSINELFAMNRPMKCSWKESATRDSEVSNIIYLDNKNLYQDVTMGDIGHSFMIYNGEYLYIWNDFNNAASKMRETNTTSGIEPKKDSAGLDQKKDFVCESWVTDRAIFIPPQNKNFEDVSDELNEAFQEMNNGGLEKTEKMICDSCKNAPTKELRDECQGEIKCD